MTATPQTTIAASMRGGYKDYGSGEAAVRALNGINVDMARGEFTAIMGPSGSGKSTLLHTLAGLDRLTAGESSIGETVITALTEAQVTQVRRDMIGFVFQSFNLIPSLTARENITLPIDIAGSKVDPEWFDTIVGVLGLGDRLTHLPAQLSAASSSALPWRARWFRAHRSFSPTSHLATSTHVREPSCSPSCATQSRTLARRS